MSSFWSPLRGVLFKIEASTSNSRRLRSTTRREQQHLQVPITDTSSTPHTPDHELSHSPLHSELPLTPDSHSYQLQTFITSYQIKQQPQPPIARNRFQSINLITHARCNIIKFATTRYHGSRTRNANLRRKECAYF